MTHYCSLLLPQRPEFADFKCLFQSDDSIFGNSRRSPGSDGLNVKRTICDVNSFDFENSDSDGEEAFSGYKTPKVEDNFDTISTVHTRGHSLSTSRRISPSASGSLTPTSPTSVCDSAYVRVRLDDVADDERVEDKIKRMDAEKSERESGIGSEDDDVNKSVKYSDSSITLSSSFKSSNSINLNRIESTQMEPFGYNCDDDEPNTKKKNSRNPFTYGINDQNNNSTPY